MPGRCAGHFAFKELDPLVIPAKAGIQYTQAFQKKR
jgi:hypothetical protein